MEIKPELPQIVQMFHRYKDREYFVDIPWIFGSFERLVRTDRLEHEVILKIDSEQKPDKIIFNGEEYILTKKPKSKAEEIQYLGLFCGDNMFGNEAVIECIEYYKRFLK